MVWISFVALESFNTTVPPPADNVIEPLPADIESVCNSFVLDPSTSTADKVIVPPLEDVDSDIDIIPDACTVTPLAPLVLDVITEVLAAPALTPKVPSLVALESAN